MMTICRMACVPHCDGSSGVKVKVKVPEVAVLTAAGFHVPVMPSSYTSGSDGGSEFWQ